MAASYELRLLDPYGAYLATIDAIESLDCALVVGGIGVLTLVLPPLYDVALFAMDTRIELSRIVAGVTEITIWLVRLVEESESGDGARRITITAFSPVEILSRRIVSEQSQSVAVAVPADDLMRLVVSQNFVSATDDARELPNLLTVAATAMSAGPAVTLEFEHREVLEVLREIAAASLADGTYLTFDLVPTSEVAFAFRTYIGVRGIDRRFGTANPIILSAARGTLTNVKVRNDWTDEKTVVYARNHGDGTTLSYSLVADNARIAMSPFGRIETSLVITNVGGSSLQSAAEAELRKLRGRERFLAEFQEQRGTRYGVELKLGDLVTAEHLGTMYDCRVEPVHLTIDANGNEVVDIQLRSTE